MNTRVNTSERTTRRHKARQTLPATLSLLLALLFILAACTIPGTPLAAPTATNAPVSSTAVAATTVAAAATVAATPTNTAVASPTVPATSPVAVGATPTTARTATNPPATPPASATPARGTPTTGRGTATPGRGTATPRAGRGTPAPATPFTVTAEEPCRGSDLQQQPLPERPATVATVEQGYRCLLLNHVDRKSALDHKVLLNGAWDVFRTAGLPAADVAPLALTGDKEADWKVYEGRYGALVAKYGRSIDTSLLARVALDGMARSLKDNHVAYLDPKLWNRFQMELSGSDKAIGAGFDLAIDEPNDRFYLYEVYPDTPAAKAGLKAGDIITQIDGQPAAKSTGSQGLYNLLTGAVGTKASMRVTRPATGQTINAQVSVAEYAVPVIEARVLDGKIGYIRLRAFSIDAGEKFDTALAGLQAQGITSIVFDVRQNGGGSTDALRRILSHFSHQGPHAITIDEDGNREEENPDPDVPLLGLPWAVLANSGSASSSDITAAFAKDRGGRLIGTKTSGSLGAAQVFELEDGSAIEITVQRVLGPNGEAINEIGVTPDQVVELTPADLSAGNDPQLAAAIAYLRGR